MSDNRETELDEAFRTRVADAFGFDGEPETFEELWDRMIAAFADGLDRPLGIDDLCTADESPHEAIVDGDVRRFRCVTDAFIFAMLRADDVTVRTVTPAAERELVVEFDAEGVVSAPDGAQLSFGVERSASPPDGPVTPEKMYGRLCPYNEAFASREEYERWAAARPGVVSEVRPLDEALTVQARLLDDALGTVKGAVSENLADGASCACVANSDHR